MVHERELSSGSTLCAGKGASLVPCSACGCAFTECFMVVLQLINRRRILSRVHQVNLSAKQVCTPTHLACCVPTMCRLLLSAAQLLLR